MLIPSRAANFACDSRNRARSATTFGVPCASSTTAAVVLQPGRPFVVDDRTVPIAGLETNRYFRCARTPDGSTVLRLARRSAPGLGQSWSGLRFDAVRDMAPGAGQ